MYIKISIMCYMSFMTGLLFYLQWISSFVLDDNNWSKKIYILHLFKAEPISSSLIIITSVLIQPVCLKNTFFYFIGDDYRNSLNVIGSVNIHFAIAVSLRLLLYFSHVRICHIKYVSKLALKLVSFFIATIWAFH